MFWKTTSYRDFQEISGFVQFFRTKTVEKYGGFYKCIAEESRVT